MRILIVSNRPAADRAKENTLIAWLKAAGSEIVVNVVNYAEVDWSSCTHEWLHKYDGVVLGGFSKTRDAKAAAEQIAALASVRVPVLGICGGFQDICRAQAKAAGHLGNVMKRISEQPVNNHELLDIPTLNIRGRMKYIRRWGVIPSAVPSVLEVLGLDAAGESVAAVRHTELPMLAFQGHPEYSPNPVSTQCLIAFFEMIAKYKEAQAHETTWMVSNGELSMRERWRLTGSQVANVRDAPQGMGRKSAVVTQLTEGALIEVLAHLGNDWVSIRAPAELAGLCTRLRHGSGKRVWSRVEESEALDVGGGACESSELSEADKDIRRQKALEAALRRQGQTS